MVRRARFWLLRVWRKLRVSATTCEQHLGWCHSREPAAAAAAAAVQVSGNCFIATRTFWSVIFCLPHCWDQLANSSTEKHCLSLFIKSHWIATQNHWNLTWWRRSWDTSHTCVFLLNSMPYCRCQEPLSLFYHAFWCWDMSASLFCIAPTGFHLTD